MKWVAGWNEWAVTGLGERAERYEWKNEWRREAGWS